VLTMASPIAAQVCQGLSAQEYDLLRGVEYQGIICASLLLKKPLASYYVTNITDSWVPFTGVIEMSALVDRAEFNQRSLVYLPKYVSCDDPAFQMTDEQIKEEFIQTLVLMYPQFDLNDVLAFRVSRVRQVFAISTLNYSEKLPPMHTSISGVHIINSAHIPNGTLNVNETVLLAERSAAELITQSRHSTVNAVRI
jgi:protoporphyrinogen oxidase